MQNLLVTAALSALTYGGLTSAAAVEYCPADSVCYSIAVPEASASSGSGNIYIQLRAPTKYSWIGLGQGSSMRGSNMFLIYADGSGNVTVSPRTGTGHVPPQANPDAEIEVLAGTGVADGTMTANFRCGNCEAWSGGEMNLASTSAGWIAAWKEGAALDSADTDAQIAQHDSVDVFQLDLTQATVADDSNPFVSSGGGDSGSGSQPGSGGSGGSGSDSSSGGAGAVTPGGAGGASQNTGTIIMAHWVIMLVVWIIMFPLGSALMPLVGKWVLHAAWQFLAFVLMWVGFGLGYIASQRIGIGFQSTHTAFGTVIVCLMVLQPVGGYLHHQHYVKHARRGAVSHAHIWYGRALMVMGVVNGGLGIKLTRGGDASGAPLTIGWSVAAAAMAVVYVAAKVFGSRRNRAVDGGRGDPAVSLRSDAGAAKENNGSHGRQYA